MTEVAGVTNVPAADNKIVFQGTSTNMVVGIAFLATGALAFTMDLTHVFFANAMAWVFVLWGGLFLYGKLMDLYETYTVTDETLIIKNPLRFMETLRVWDWAHIHRVDVVVKRTEAMPEDLLIQIYYTAEGEIVIEREDRVYDAELARLVIERAGLKPTSPNNPKDLTHLPQVKTVYTWNKSGKLVTA